MAQFRAGIQGNKGATTRLGSKASGIHTFTDGWNSGVDVDGYVDEYGRDVFEVFQTGGSHAARSKTLIARIVDGRDARYPEEASA